MPKIFPFAVISCKSFKYCISTHLWRLQAYLISYIISCCDIFTIVLPMFFVLSPSFIFVEMVFSHFLSVYINPIIFFQLFINKYKYLRVTPESSSFFVYFALYSLTSDDTIIYNISYKTRYFYSNFVNR